MYDGETILEHQKIVCSGRRNDWNYKCNCCGKQFQKGETRNRWRLNIPNSFNYLRGQFWTIQCNDCLLRTKEEWLAGLEKLQV